MYSRGCGTKTQHSTVTALHTLTNTIAKNQPIRFIAYYIIFIPYVNENEITDIVQSLKNSSAGHDSILASIGKTINPILCEASYSFYQFHIFKRIKNSQSDYYLKIRYSKL